MIVRVPNKNRHLNVRLRVKGKAANGTLSPAKPQKQACGTTPLVFRSSIISSHCSSYCYGICKLDMREGTALQIRPFRQLSTHCI